MVDALNVISIFIFTLLITLICCLVILICIVLLQCLCFSQTNQENNQENIELEEHEINIEDLSKHIINVEHPIIPKNHCIICLGDFEENDNLCTLKYCEHTYHKDCIKRWIYEKPICPLCQIVVI